MVGFEFCLLLKVLLLVDLCDMLWLGLDGSDGFLDWVTGDEWDVAGARGQDFRRPR
jgi:hypothetical protein